MIKQGVALTESNRTGPPSSVGRAPGPAAADRPPAGSVIDDDDDRRQTTASETILAH